MISGKSQKEIWQRIEEDFSQKTELFDYDALIEQNGKKINLTIDIDLGGGFEGGYAFTTFIAELEVVEAFRFALHHQSFMDRVGKFFGLQDVVLGFPEFDKSIVVKTNDSARLKDVLSDGLIREVLQGLPKFDFHITHHTSDYTQVEAAFLELRIEEGITEPDRLREIYNAFFKVLVNIDEGSGSILNYL